VVERIQIVGMGRVGSAVAARLRERGHELTHGDAELVLLCVPDRAISEVAPTIPAGPWVAHTSGATRLAALDPHERRFSLHPLQSFTHARGAEQTDAVVAASYLVTLHKAAADMLEAAGAPPEALVPLMRRVIENDFELTGPAIRGDWETVEAHLAAIRERLPELEPLYRTLADATAEQAVR
jgi:predicted short-subunit dehydrogenase-like oxidoreductase (DUF2520 family)